MKSKSKKKEIKVRIEKITSPAQSMSGLVKSEDATGVAKLRRLVAKLEAVGPVVPVGIAVSLLGMSRTHVWRLMREGRLQTQAVEGAELVCLRSVLRHAEWRQERQKKRAERLLKEADKAVNLMRSPHQSN